jgi:hypothetical protein
MIVETMRRIRTQIFRDHALGQQEWRQKGQWVTGISANYAASADPLGN